MKRIKLYSKIFNKVYSLSYNAEGQGLIDKHYCIAAVVAEDLVRFIQNNYRRRKK